MASGYNQQHPPGWDEHLIFCHGGTATALCLCHITGQWFHIFWPISKALFGGEILQRVFQGLIQGAPDQIRRRRYLHLCFGQRIHSFWDSGRKAKGTACKWRVFHRLDLCRESHFLHHILREKMIPEENLQLVLLFLMEISVNPDYPSY